MSTEDLDRLRLVASAIAGRTVEVAATEPGQPAWTDGATVYLDASADASHQVRALSVQASLIAGGSLEPGILRQLARRPALSRRYLALEGARALAANDGALPPWVRGMVDVDLAGQVAGPEQSLARARRRQSIADPPTIFGTIHPRRVLALVARAEEDVARTGERPGQPESRTLPELEEDANGGEYLGDLISSPVGGGGAIGRLLRRMLSPTRARGEGGPPGADAPTHVTRARPGAGARSSTSLPGLAEQASAPTTGGVAYPEWDVHRRRYRPDWCTVLEADPPPATAGAGLVLPDGRALRRALSRLGLGLTPCRRRRQGDDIDIDAAVEARVDTVAGSPHEDDFYVESLRRRRDLAVLVLLDVSGSAGEPGTTGRPVHEQQRAAAAALTVALHELGDRVALYAFNSRGRTAVQFLRVKTFDDRLDGQVARRLDGLLPAAYTRLGAAIRHGTTVLDERGGTPGRLLVVLSDGFAYDHGYQGRYGEADARRALAEARRRGVGCLCLSVGTIAEPAALRRVFGPAAHATVARADQLPAIIGPLFRAAVRSADVQRRAFQRAERTRERRALEEASR